MANWLEDDPLSFSSPGDPTGAVEHAYSRVCNYLKVRAGGAGQQDLSHTSWPQSPEQLDLVEQLKAKAIRKKTAAETRLKTAVQSQLDDVREGMGLVERCARLASSNVALTAYFCFADVWETSPKLAISKQDEARSVALLQSTE